MTGYGLVRIVNVTVLWSEALIVSWLSPQHPHPVTVLLDAPFNECPSSCLHYLFPHDHLMGFNGDGVLVVNL